ncbi:glutamyl-tRNA(Gln) amidotransferase subunit C, mitochondrial [Anopheles ziemanni]|uniref:glutamyl-tRNA(Gln) amidotransferase subunit C, mitochondrial n=1 Tax=Anopheles coustani TaxID=139045 RepID=UPI002657F531|nr:glutamyl-tRNA(Gln) amidotransferase subunit C, mitochondrial [Anopheles coustani]XP_058170113.1 glutamyl-tRNA(Gln) amidotransferase subunit C, mitochondrial [Anopheles ziemanni]
MKTKVCLLIVVVDLFSVRSLSNYTVINSGWRVKYNFGKLNMFRGIATRIVHRSFATVHATPPPPSVTKDIQNRIWEAKRLRYPTKVPQNPIKSSTEVNESGPGKTTPIVLTDQTVRLLERLSLVNLDSKEAYKTLQDSIEFASRILHIETDGVQPLYCVLEQHKLTLRPDIVDDGGCQEEVLKNAAITEEEYFVAPPGNIPLEQS